MIRTLLLSKLQAASHCVWLQRWRILNSNSVGNLNCSSFFCRVCSSWTDNHHFTEKLVCFGSWFYPGFRELYKHLELNLSDEVGLWSVDCQHTWLYSIHTYVELFKYQQSRYLWTNWEPDNSYVYGYDMSTCAQRKYRHIGTCHTLPTTSQDVFGRNSLFLRKWSSWTSKEPGGHTTGSGTKWLLDSALPRETFLLTSPRTSGHLENSGQLSTNSLQVIHAYETNSSISLSQCSPTDRANLFNVFSHPVSPQLPPLQLRQPLNPQ